MYYPRKPKDGYESRRLRVSKTPSTPEDLLTETLKIIAREMRGFRRLQELNGSQARALTDYGKLFLAVIKDQRVGAEDLDLDSIEDDELAQLTKKALETLKK